MCFHNYIWRDQGQATVTEQSPPKAPNKLKKHETTSQNIIPTNIVRVPTVRKRSTTEILPFPGKNGQSIYDKNLKFADYQFNNIYIYIYSIASGVARTELNHADAHQEKSRNITKTRLFKYIENFSSKN